MKGQWKQVPGLPHYEASRDGFIRSMKTGRGVRSPIGHVMSGCPDAKGYLLVNCTIDGRNVSHRVHRLIARTYLGEIPPGFQINHKNGKKDDNRASNLEIVSPSQNLRHRHEVLKIKINWRGSRHGLAKLDEQKVREIRRRSAQGAISRHLAEEYGVCVGTIDCVVKRKTWTHVR